MASEEITHYIKILEDRMVSLEARHAFQDDIIEQLNQEITVHQYKIAELKQQLTMVASRLKESASSNIGKQEDEPPPPHY